MKRFLLRPRSWWLAPATAPVDRLLTVLMALVPLLVALAWRIADSGACFLGPDASLWGIATHAMAQLNLEIVAKVGRPPVYPVLGAIASLVTPDTNAALMLTSAGALGLLNGWMYRWVGGRWGRLAGMAAGLTLPTQAGMLVHATRTSAEATFFLMLFMGVIAIVALDRRPNAPRAALAGVVLALATLCKPQGLLLLPLAAVLPLVGADGKRRWALPVVTIGAYAAVIGAWQLVTMGQDALLTHLTLALTDAAGGDPNEKADKWVMNLLAEEYDTSWFQSTSLPRPLAMAVVNVDRIGGFIADNIGGLWWAPLGWVGAGWLQRDRRLRRDARVVLACSACFVFALPVYWQERHFVPFLLPASMVGAAGITALLGSRLRLPRRFARPVVFGTLLGAAWGIWQSTEAWDKARRANRCDDGSAVAAAFLANITGQHGPGQPKPRLANHHRGIEVHGGFTESAGMEAPNPFLGWNEELLHPQQPQVFYLVLYPFLRDKPRTWAAVYNNGMDTRAEMIFQERVDSDMGEAEMMIFRMYIYPNHFSTPRYRATPPMGYYQQQMSEASSQYLPGGEGQGHGGGEDLGPINPPLDQIEQGGPRGPPGG